jgi:hypothetical protein
MKFTTRMFSLAIAAAMCLSASLATASTISWATYESTAITVTPATDNGPFLAETGVGITTGHHASAATIWSTPVGNGSVKSFSSDHWGVGDYYQFQVATLGLTGVGLQFDQTGSNTGPKDFGVFYSTNGTTFTQFGSNYAVLANGGSPNASWGSATYQSAYTNFFDLSSVTGLDNQATVFFRLVDQSTTSTNGGTVGTGGTSRVDNVIVTSPAAFTTIPVPEPSTILLGSFGMIGLVGLARRRK